MKNSLNKIFAIILIITSLGSLILPNFAYADALDAPIDPFAGQNLSGAGQNLSNAPGTLGDLLGGGSSIGGGLTDLLSGSIFVPTGTVLDAPRTAEQILKNMIVAMARMMIHNLTQQIVMLIRTGGKSGTPLFVQNWQSFLLDAANQASGQFIQDLGLTKLCQPFALRLRIMFSDDGDAAPIYRRYACTVTDVANNFQNFYNDFNNGGWARWIQITQPQNNIYGAYLGLAIDKETQQSVAVQASLNEAISANGFLNITEKTCTTNDNVVTYDSEQGPIYQPVQVCNSKTVSPGKYLENRLAEATTDDIRQLGLAQSFNEIIMAAFQALIQNIFFSQGGLASGSVNSSSVSVPLQNSLNNLQQNYLQVSGIDQAISREQTIINIKRDSAARIQNEIQILGQLQSCLTSKNFSLSDVQIRLSTASSTLSIINNEIIDNMSLLSALQNDRAAIVSAQSVNDLNNLLYQVSNDINKVTAITDATNQNNQIATDQSKASSDLSTCQTGSVSI